MIVLDVNLLGACYTTLLALRFMRRNPPEVESVLILISSGTGLYPVAVQPFYAASKHTIIGLVSSIALYVAHESIRVYGPVPDLVPMGIMPQGIIDTVDPSLITPVSHIVYAVNDIFRSPERVGAICEASVDKLFYRGQPEYPDEAEGSRGCMQRVKHGQ